MYRVTLDVKGVPLEGGAITVRDPGLLKLGQFSMVQNVKATHPGFKKRKGQRKLVTSNDATNQLMTGFQFKKTSSVSTDNIFVLQASDGDLLTLSAAPPVADASLTFAELYSGNGSPKPASWGNLNDVLIVSTAVDQHLLYPGVVSPVQRFVKYTEGGNPINSNENIFDDGFDYTQEVTDGQSSTSATLSSLSTAANGDGIFICTPLPAKSFTFTMATTNSTASAATLYYWKTDGSWASVSGLTDGTESPAGTSLGQSGTMTFTVPTDQMDRLLFGTVGYWYLIVFAAGLDASCTVSAVSYSANVCELKALWDGIPVLAPMVLVDNAGTGTVFDTYDGSAVNIDSLADGSLIYIFSTDPVEGFYLDPGSTPDADAQTIAANGIKYWNGTAWSAKTILHDGSEGINHAGWVLFDRDTDEQPRLLKASKLYGYWYQLEFDDAVAANVIISVYTMPYFDIHDWGYYGQSSCVWKGRALYTFTDKWPEYVYITAADSPQVLTGIDAAVIQVGDGRPHKVTSIKNFFNNVLVFQEEKGEIGGCITILQGYDPPTFGKLVLSTKMGTMSAKSVDVVENVYTATATDEKLKTVAFFISRYGVGMCDGTSIGIISDDIQNYFDSNDTNCIRHGYEDQMWLKHDPVDHVLRLGLVCGSSATTPNVFPVYDLITRNWYFDVRGQNLSFWENWEAGSGTAAYVQVAGGVADGLLYQTNVGTADVAAAIETYIRMEFPGYGQYMDLTWFLLSCVAQTGNVTMATYANNIAKDTLTLSMEAEYSTQSIRRHLMSLNVLDQHVAVKLSNSSATESMTLLTAGVQIKLWESR